MRQYGQPLLRKVHHIPAEDLQLPNVGTRHRHIGYCGAKIQRTNEHQYELQHTSYLAKQSPSALKTAQVNNK